MSEGCVQPCLSWSAFKVMSLMMRPFCCALGMPPLTGRLCRQTQAASLGQILIVLNRWDVTANDRRSIPLKSRTYVDVAAGDKRPPQRQAIGMCSALRSNHGPQLRKAEGDSPPQIDSDRCEPPRRRRDCDFAGTHPREPHVRCARTRRMVATSRSNSIGVLSNSSHPAAIAFSRSPASARTE